MESRIKIYELLESFNNDNMSVEEFCNQIGAIYFFEISAYLNFSDDENKYLQKLIQYTERYTNNTADLESGVYYDDEKIISIFNLIYPPLIKLKSLNDK